MNKPLCPFSWISGVPKEIERCLTSARPLGSLLLVTLGILIGLTENLFGAYTPYFTDSFYTLAIDTTKWYQNGSLSGIGGGGTCQCGLWGDGSLISKVTAPIPSNDYDVEIGVRPANGSTFVQYLRASNDAVSGPTPSGTYYAIELQNITFPGYYTNYGTATLAIYKRVSGVIT